MIYCAFLFESSHDKVLFSMPQTQTRLQVFLLGARDTFPLIVGAVPFGIIFGALAVSNGIHPLTTAGLSLFVFAGSAQFIAVNLIAQHTSVALIVLTTFMVNLRHALYGASIAPHTKHLSQRWLIPLAFWLTDETYAVVVSKWTNAQQTLPHLEWYHLGSSLAMYGNWQLVTWIGILAGSQFQNAEQWGLDFAMAATFLGIVVPSVINRPMLVCALVAGVVGILANGLPNNSGLMVGAFAGILAGYLVETYLTPAQEQRA